MTVAVPSDEAVARELWSSFLSLLRSYTSAHGLNGTRQAVLEVGSGTLLIRAGDRTLRINHDGPHGTWQREIGDTTAFTLDVDGTITACGETAEMDIVAERLAREIMR